MEDGTNCYACQTGGKVKFRIFVCCMIIIKRQVMKHKSIIAEITDVHWKKRIRN